MLESTNQLAIAVAVSLVALGIIYHRRFHNADYKVPPGPPGIPFLGNVLQIPGQHLATYFRSLLEQYGSIVSLNLAGMPVILIGNIELAHDLLEKHSAKHSSRPVVPYMRYHTDPTMIFWSSAEQGEMHNVARKLSAGIMSAVRAGKTEALQQFEALLNVQLLLDDAGKNWFHYMERFAASVVLSAGFGMHCPTGHEPELKTILEVLAEGVQLFTPAGSIINVFPFLDLIPGPMPWRTRAKAFREKNEAVFNKIIHEALAGKTSHADTWVAEFAREDKPEGDQRRLVIQFTVAAIETTTISLQTFVLACIRYPGWVATAQKEIDSVVGTDRLPSFKDRPFLPYVDAIVRETLRWRPSVRFGIPHMSTAEDVIEYLGRKYYIPQGSVIFPVTWAIEHDQSKFEDHDRFMPERFLDAEGKLKSSYDTSAFGFGRRICPGIPFAERSLWITIVTMLWTFNIHGSGEIDPDTGLPFLYDDSDAGFSGDLTSAPLKFPAVFEPRSPQRAEIARMEWAESEKDINILLPTV